MPRRVSLPGANELFRPTVGNHEPERAKASKNTETKTAKASPPSASGGKRAGSGRIRHDEKITVYVSTEELTNDFINAIGTNSLLWRPPGWPCDPRESTPIVAVSCAHR